MIEVRNVTKKYGNFYAVRNISFNVDDGEIIGFLGRNGAGKTTTMNMITGFIEPTDGQILVDGYDIDRKPKKVKELIGYMPEGVPQYSELTVKEFISYMAELKRVNKKDRKEAVEKAITETGLKTVENKLTRNLSRGYKQRVSMAGAIVGDPKILILDEPTVGLDPKQVVEIRELIKSFRKNHTVILSSHILSEVSQICEKVVIIDKGEIVAVDSPENLEKATSDTERIIVNVEDPSHNFEKLKDKNDAINSISLSEEKDDGTYVYEVSSKKDSDIRKILFKLCAENNITLLEMKQEESSLEDAFMKLVENRPELSFKEQKKLEYERELEAFRQEEEDARLKRIAKKQAKLEEKARKIAEKQEKRLEKESEEDKKEDKKEDKTEEIVEEVVEEKELEEVKEEKTKKKSSKKSKEEEDK